MENFHILRVKHHVRPNLAHGVIISSTLFTGNTFVQEKSSGQTVVQIAEEWLKEQGFDLVGIGEQSDHFVFISRTFKPLK